MKRTIIAFIAGAVLATAGSVYAEDIKTLIGKQIQGEFPVKVSGETLDKKAIVVDGTSYLPVRAIGDALNMNVKFNSELGVELTPKEGSKLSSETSTEPKQMSQEDIDTIKSSEEQIGLAKNRNEERKAKITQYESDLKTEEEKLAAATDDFFKQTYQFSVNNLTNMIKSEKESIQADEKIIIDLQSYIAKIKAKYE